MYLKPFNYIFLKNNYKTILNILHFEVLYKQNEKKIKIENTYFYANKIFAFYNKDGIKTKEKISLAAAILIWVGN